MTAVEHSPVNRADEAVAGDQSGSGPRASTRETRGPGRLDRDLAATVAQHIQQVVAVDDDHRFDQSEVYGMLRDIQDALVRPVEGVVLTPEEARLADLALREYGSEPHTLDYRESDAMDALAERLEAST